MDRGSAVSRTRIKICGITRPGDAINAAEAGADAIGLVFYAASSRAVSIAQAREIAQAVPPLVTLVGLFVNHDAKAVRGICDQVPLDLLQFHGDETAAFCDQFAQRWIRGVRARDPEVVESAFDTYHRASGILMDAYNPDRYGGTGTTFNWDWLPSNPPRPLILAGGLTPDNVAGAVSQVRPWAVDVSGGVEDSPGIKSAELMQQFAREVDRGYKTD